MTATQSLKIFEVLQRHFKNDADAKVVVEEIEHIVENKFEANKSSFVTKDDIGQLRLSIQEVKTEIVSSRVEMEKRFNSMLMWMIGTMIALIGIVVTILKLSS
jgi:hypothetical protein